MKVNQLRFGSVLSYLQMAVNFIIGMVYTPVMLRLLGQSEYGLYNTVASTISMLSVLKLGFNSSYIRYFSKYKVKNDEESIKDILEAGTNFKQMQLASGIDHNFFQQYGPLTN